jgi:fatty acid desaturase
MALIKVRIFVLFHDCAHNAFFPNQTVNQVRRGCESARGRRL